MVGRKASEDQEEPHFDTTSLEKPVLDLDVVLNLWGEGEATGDGQEML